MTFPSYRVSGLSRALLILVCFSSTGHAQTAPNPAPRTLAEAAAQQTRTAGGTDIVARTDSPRVTNILPWQEQQLSTPKNPLSISALDGSLSPTDRDRLVDEIQYSRLLSQPTLTTPSNRP